MINMDIAAYQNMRISTRGKRPLRNLTPGDKVRAIQRIHNGETKASVSRDIGVPESTLRGWCKNEQKLRFMCRQLGAAMNEHQSVNLSVLEHSTEKRAKLVDPYECFGQSYALNNLSLINAVGNHANNTINGSRMDNTIFNNNNFEADKKDNATAENEAFFKNVNALSACSRFPQLPLIPNAHLLSFLNQSHNAQPTPSLPPPMASNSATGCKLNGIADKIPLRNSNNAAESKHKSKRSMPPSSVKSVSSELLRMPKFPFDKCESNNNAAKTAPSTLPSSLDTKTNDLSTIFPLGLPLPLPALPAFGVDNNETPNNVMLQWTKVFNASLNFLALAAAAAAVQAPRLSELPDAPSSPQSDSSDTAYHHDEFEFGLTHQLEHSEESNFESEPEDLSVRSGTSKISSPPQTPSRDLMSDSSILSDNEH